MVVGLWSLTCSALANDTIVVLTRGFSSVVFQYVCVKYAAIEFAKTVHIAG